MLVVLTLLCVAELRLSEKRESSVETEREKVVTSHATASGGRE